MATPISAALRAGASLTPSPVIATTAPPACKARTSCSFWAGITRANTSTWRTRSASTAGLRLSRSVPLSTGPGGRPAWSAIERAVVGPSPVIITTRNPA